MEAPAVGNSVSVIPALCSPGEPGVQSRGGISSAEQQSKSVLTTAQPEKGMSWKCFSLDARINLPVEGPVEFCCDHCARRKELLGEAPV